MTNETTGGTQRPLDERVRVLEQVVTIITDRQAEIARLSDATEDLTKGVASVDNTLTNVGSLMMQVNEVKGIANEANSKADDTATAMILGEHRYRRRTRLYALLAVAISVTFAAGGVLIVASYAHTNRQQFASFLDTAMTRCEQRLVYDQANHLSVGADVNYYRSQLQQARDNKASTDALIAAFPKAQRATLRAEVRAAHVALRTALAVKEQAFNAGVIGSCSSLH